MQCILFDLDGTLIDTSALYVESFKVAVSPFMPELPSLQALLKERRPASERAFLVDLLGEAQASIAHHALCDAYEAHAPRLLGGFFEGVAAMLDALKEAKVPMGLVTGKSQRAFDSTCTLLKLRDYFDVVVLEDHVPAPKPDPAGLNQALASLGLSAKDAIYVGDSDGDMVAAQRAGMPGVLAVWGHGAEAREQLVKSLTDNTSALAAPMDLAQRLGPMQRSLFDKAHAGGASRS